MLPLSLEFLTISSSATSYFSSTLTPPPDPWCASWQEARRRYSPDPALLLRPSTPHHQGLQKERHRPPPYKNRPCSPPSAQHFFLRFPANSPPSNFLINPPACPPQSLCCAAPATHTLPNLPSAAPSHSHMPRISSMEPSPKFLLSTIDFPIFVLGGGSGSIQRRPQDVTQNGAHGGARDSRTCRHAAGGAETTQCERKKLGLPAEHSSDESGAFKTPHHMAAPGMLVSPDPQTRQRAFMIGAFPRSRSYPNSFVSSELSLLSHRNKAHPAKYVSHLSPRPVPPPVCHYLDKKSSLGASYQPLTPRKASVARFGKKNYLSR
ncbi:hypothetical protein VP01_3017g2 [Puccinia sorghi]|uniref:Uncharacterized protein n=1 Tax=Puccinia sorghi TaxID=27349 RepID=A0A0L6V0Y4_9BASI|nr:hypothetical protein VP01_3017g2 [Puccinia sorghi]